ncbi:hypothetical protein AU05_13370 [Ectopseudomonas composti]|jgi:hypothetical protein|uniref:Strictosidine synthase conserved region domain-containing protein n=1 Tax=Ectopseudomonas composti TaxID=658457 RepID=A0ABN0SHB7_9GAMM|nr:hypothetical protein [Pseudomonas composti]EZH84053.1 hypothetical protein AU05_13370 [Pseudomonas composti]
MNMPLRLLKNALLAAAALVAAALIFFSWQYFFPVQAASGWSYRVAYDGVQKAAGLARAPGGGILVSQELQDGQGSILLMQPDGEREVVVEGLSKPDGLLSARGGLVFSQESGDKPVSFLQGTRVSELFEGDQVQGLWDDGHYLYAIEDRKGNGRLWRYRWDDRKLSVVRDNLSETESITRCTDGRMLYSEKETGVIRELREDGRDPVVIEGLRNPTFMLCDEQGLWISEDSTHRARLLLVDAQGEQTTVLSFLKAPQAILPLESGRYLIAEGGRDRVLELSLNKDDGFRREPDSSAKHGEAAEREQNVLKGAGG